MNQPSESKSTHLPDKVVKKTIWKFRRVALLIWTIGAVITAAPTVEAAKDLAADRTNETENASSPETPQTISRARARVSIAWLTDSSRHFGEIVDRSAARIAPEWGTRPVFFGVSMVRIAAGLTLLILVAIVAGGVMRVLRNYAGRITDEAEQTWPRMILSAVRKPLALTIGTYGGFFALSLLIDAMQTTADLGGYQRFFAGFTYAGLIFAAFWLVFRVIGGTERKLRVWANRSDGVLDNVLVPVVGTALRLLVPLLGLFILLGALRLPPSYEWATTKLLAILLISSVAYLIIRATTVSERALLQGYRMDVADNLRAREVYTQVSVIRKIFVTSTVFLAVACMLMLFQPVRQLGTSILASAGIAGVVLGFAAQKTLSNLFAGIQIAISQPIRIDDVVIVEGEWGRIEQITLTFVTVCIWDLRRLVLPINYFIEKPFQNWTRNSADLLNSVFIYADYTLPVEALRTELKRLLDESPLWDRKAWVLQVTDSTPQAMEIRCLMSSSDASKGWDLKCKVREGLIHFIQKDHPTALPRVRAELQRDSHRPESQPIPHMGAGNQGASSSPGLDQCRGDGSRQYSESSQ